MIKLGEFLGTPFIKDNQKLSLKNKESLTTIEIIILKKYQDE